MPDQSNVGLAQRRVAALEALAAGINDIADVLRKRYGRDYPEPREVSDATVTHPKTSEEALRESQGATGESDEEWIGRRERKYEADKAAKAIRKAPRS